MQWKNFSGVILKVVFIMFYSIMVCQVRVIVNIVNIVIDMCILLSIFNYTRQ